MHTRCPKLLYFMNALSMAIALDEAIRNVSLTMSYVKTVEIL